MKTIKLSDYSEKLKINSMSLDDFDKIDTMPINKIYTKYQKDDLKTGDVCQIRKKNKIGVIILGKDKINLNWFGLYKFIGHDVLMLCNTNENTKWTVLVLTDYDKQLKDATNLTEYDIIKVMPNAIDLEMFNNPDELEKRLKTYKELI